MQEKISKEERITLLLSAAKKKFAEKGYYATSIDDIIQEADVARGTFYLHFEGKRPIFDAILLKALDELNENIRGIRIGAEEATPVEQLKANFHRVFNMLLEDSDLAKILFYRALGIDDEAVEQINQFYARVAEMLKSALDHGMALGLLASIDSHIASYCILGSIKEAFTSLILHNEPTEDEISITIEQILKLHLYGLYTRSI